MEQHKDCIRGYHRGSKAWYAKALNKENIDVNFGMYHPEGGTTGEMTMEWVELNGLLCPQLKCFDDGWSALSLFTDLIEKMGEVDEERISEEEFCKMLDDCGFKDLTAYKDPYKNQEEPQEEMVSIEMPKSKAEQLGLI